MLPTNDCDYSSTSTPHQRSHRHLRVRDNRQGAGGETTLSETRRGGIRHAVVQSSAIAVARRARARPLPPGPRPGPSRHRCRAPLPPALAEPCPPHLVPSGLDNRPPHPCQKFREPPYPPPSPPNGNNDADDQRSVDATMDLSPEDYMPWAIQSTLLSSTPPQRM